MLFPKNIKDKLSFTQILKLTEEHCETALGKVMISKLKFTSDLQTIQARLVQTSEMKAILESAALNVNLQIDIDLKESYAKAKGFYYLEEDLVDILDALRSIEKVFAFFEDKNETYPELCSIFGETDIDFSLLTALDKILDREGQIKPNASKKLEKISAQIKSKEKSIIARSNSLFQESKDKGLLADTELGIKAGRVVLPVLSEHKKKVKGLLIDQSATGKISYIEPLELVEINNQLSELVIARRLEIINILKSITKHIVPNLGGIKLALRKLAVYDFLRAKARLALDNNWHQPKLHKKKMELINARHPLLEMRLKAENTKPVPLNLSLDEQQRLVVISGPNAGGKSVTLKTLGLLQYMVQCGYLVPCDAASKMMIFENIFVDIGDDQSIESDLSTYSSHLKAAKHIINFSDESTLVLMDEIGTGTDPMFGGPIAEAILEEIHAKKAYGIITTHFSNIKNKAKSLEYAINAAMLFDTEELQPLYKLSIGQAGSSFAFEVATNIGLNKKVIKKARKYTNTKQYDLDKLLAEVQQQKEELTQSIELNSKEAASAERYAAEYKQLKAEIEDARKQLLNQAKLEAKQILEDANKTIENTIRTIQESKADKKQTQNARKILEAKKGKSSPLKEEVKEVPIAFKVGDRVRLKNTDSAGEIIALYSKTAEVAIGSIKTKTKLNNLEMVGAQQAKKVKKYISDQSYNDRQMNFSTELDIRGLRTIDAINEVDKWIDSAIILGFSKLRLLHGKGDGILKNQIRSHLKPNAAVKSISYERVELGGEGVSIIELV